MAGRAIGVTASISYEVGSDTVEIPEAYIINTPKVTTTKIETTHLGLTTNTMTSEPGLDDSGTLGFECRYEPSLYKDLWDMKGNGDIIGWTVAAPDGHGMTWEFDAWIQDMEESFAPNERNTMKVTIQITGPVTVSVEEGE